MAHRQMVYCTPSKTPLLERNKSNRDTLRVLVRRRQMFPADGPGAAELGVVPLRAPGHEENAHVMSDATESAEDKRQ